MTAPTIRGIDHYGRITHTARQPEPLCVFGGYKMAYCDWYRSEDGWEMDVDYEGLPSTVFPTIEACQAAIDELLAPEVAVAA